MDFVAVNLKIIAGLGGLCGDYQRGVEYVQAKCATEISIRVVGSARTVKQKGTFLLLAGPDPQEDKLRLLGSVSSLRPFRRGVRIWLQMAWRCQTASYRSRQ